MRTRFFLRAALGGLALLLATGAPLALVKAAGLVKGQVGEPPTRPLGRPDEGRRTTPDLVIGRSEEPRGHMEIVSYGWLAPRDSGARYRDQLCTSIEHVPGEIDFGSCASVAQMAEEDRPIRIELSMQQLSPKAERRTEIGGMLAPAVASVEVRFHRRGQSKRYSVSATVARPYSELQEELKQPGPFGYFVSQLKGLVGLGAIRVLAFDESGNLLGVAHGLSSQPLS